MSSKSNVKLFIDANIYLSFYNSDAVELPELLLPLEEAKESIFITSEIVDEVVRHRYRIVYESFEIYRQKTVVSVNTTTLTKHISASLRAKHDLWTDHRKTMLAIAKQQNKLFSEIQKKSLELVYKGMDDVSMALEKIFLQAISATPKEIADATTRKAVGNPPGKKQKMGDELNWEQMLNQLDGIETLIIVSHDSDYNVGTTEEPLLHPFLLREVRKRYPKLQVTLHNSLNKAITYFNTLQPKTEKLTLPKKAVLDTIEKEEQNISGSTIFNHNSYITDTINSFTFCGGCLSYTRTRKLIHSSLNPDFDTYYCDNCGTRRPLEYINTPH